MGFRLERQDAQIREMTRALADLGKFVKPNLCSLMMLCCVIKFCLESSHNSCSPFIRILFLYYCLLSHTLSIGVLHFSTCFVDRVEYEISYFKPIQFYVLPIFSQENL